MHGRVAFLPCVPVALKCLKPKDTDFQPKTLGEHVRRRRLELKLSQLQAALRIGVNPWTVLNWEKGHTELSVEAMPAVLQFLGYDPLSEGMTTPDRLRQKRRQMGWNQRKLAEYLGVDRCTVASWELGGTILRRSDRVMVARFLGLAEGDLMEEMAHRWNMDHSKPPTNGS